MKDFAVIAFFTLAVIALLNSCSAQNKNDTDVTFGQSPYADKLISEDRVHVSSGFLRVVKDMRTYTTNGRANITMITVSEIKDKKNGAYVTIVSGGPGTTHATIAFTSRRNHGIHKLVQVYGII